MRYLVNDIYPCIQGEGVNTGVPMMLVRLHGCPVECVFCDTRETWTIDPNNEVEALTGALGTSPRYARVSPETIVEQIDALNPSRGIGRRTRYPRPWRIGTSPSRPRLLGELRDKRHGLGSRGR